MRLYGILVFVKATFDIPDALYRKVKAKSAISGLPIRAVAIRLFDVWVNETPRPAPAAVPQQTPSWFGIARPYAAKAETHDMASIRVSIAKGRAGYECRT